MILHPSDEGYDTIFAFWQTTNGAVRFNYQGYFWLTYTDEDGRYFTRGNPLESFSGVGHEDRPYHIG